MNFEPRPYQIYAIEQIINKPAVGLMLDMGLGKTVVTLTAIEKLLYDYYAIHRVLVIAPLRVAEAVWSDEIEKWYHLSSLQIQKVLGSSQRRIEALKKNADIYIINRENVPWLVEVLKSRWYFDMVIIDESSSFKNPQAKRFKALRKVRPLIKRIVELTGTPAPNGFMDLWSQMFLLDGGERLGKTIGEYRRRYFTPAASNGHIVYSWKMNPYAENEITDKIKDICVSMKSEDYLALPDVIYNVVKVKIPCLDKYKKMERDLVLQIDSEEIAAASAGVLSNKLLQMANGFLYSEKELVKLHTAKIEALKELAETGKNLLVFYWYKQDLELILGEFKEAKELKTSKEIKAWNEGRIKIMLVHPASAGHGLNLQYGGDMIVWYGLTWSLELYQQANKRLHRSGQSNKVIIHHLVAEGTIDEDVMKALENKCAGQSKMLEAIKARLEQAYLLGKGSK